MVKGLNRSVSLFTIRAYPPAEKPARKISRIRRGKSYRWKCLHPHNKDTGKETMMPAMLRTISFFEKKVTATE
jgi:hypothetical protein